MELEEKIAADFKKNQEKDEIICDLKLEMKAAKDRQLEAEQLHKVTAESYLLKLKGST